MAMMTVESCSSIRISDLQTKIRRLIDQEYPESSEEEIFNHTQNELRKFTVNGQTFEYHSRKNHLGGYRWFFVCPKCKHNVDKLILPPPEAKGRERLYLCKGCHRLRNQSAVLSNNSMYQKVTKPMKRMKEIEDKLAAGHLSMDKVKEYLDEYESLENGLKSTTEYRLYMFRKKRGTIS